MKSLASPSPTPPPTAATTIVSTITSTSTKGSEKPTAFSTASSRVRSRTAMAIVLPVTSRSVKNTTLPMVVIRSSMLPICFTHDAANAFSVSVFVSAGEFANSSSIALTTRTAESGLSMRTVYQPTFPLRNCLRSSR